MFLLTHKSPAEIELFLTVLGISRHVMEGLEKTLASKMLETAGNPDTVKKLYTMIGGDPDDVQSDARLRSLRPRLAPWNRNIGFGTGSQE